MDLEGWFSVTPEAIARHQAGKFRKCKSSLWTADCGVKDIAEGWKVKDYFDQQERLQPKRFCFPKKLWTWNIPYGFQYKHAALMAERG